MTTSLARARRAGFTLIELLTVIVILSILTFFLVSNVFQARESVESAATGTMLGELSLALAEMQDADGDYPASAFGEQLGSAPNETNLGAECLYLALCAEDAPGAGKFDEDPINSDGDQAALRPAGHQSLSLFEIADSWGNPVAYFHNRDYGRKDTYVCYSDLTGEEEQVEVTARKNEKTRRWHSPRGFQLLSPGPNGVFDIPGSEEDDDIVHFGR